jgi:hypothetical protein
MAKSECTTVPIEKTEHDYYTIWKGPREGLIAAGICTADQFPEGRKRVLGGILDGAGPGRPILDATLAPDGLWLTRRSRDGVYEHRKLKSLKQLKLEKQAQIAQEELEWVKDPEALRKQMRVCALFMDVLLRYASGEFEILRRGETRVWLEPEAFQRLVKLRSQVLSIVENAKICERRNRPDLRLVH